MDTGGLAGAVFNAAKERALDAFIAKRIGFMEMAQVVETVLDQMIANSSLINDTMTLDTVLNTDQMARDRADDVMKQRAG
jgi:1-deoxy-D-xylulose-5-phosphate reductoisomerase